MTTLLARRFSAATLAGAMLAACGGGSDSTNPDAQPTETALRAAALAAAPTADSSADPTAPVPFAGDTVKPTVTLTSPASLAAGLTGTVNVTADASDDVGVASVRFRLDGALIDPLVTSPPYGVSIDTTLYPPGQHVIGARARDTAGNVSEWGAVTVQFGGSRQAPAGFTLNPSWVTGLNQATAFAQLPDGRILIAQQGGTLRLVKQGKLLPQPFLQLAVDSNGERGLLGVTPHPNFSVNGFFYVYYTTLDGGSHNRVSRFTVDAAAGGDVALPGSEFVLIDLPPLQAQFHNGGAIHFGKDGKLFVAVGDNKRSALAQDLSQPMGKMLRINANGTIPPGNPFYSTQTGLGRAVWAYGLRNPFTFAVHPETGRIHINDVGEHTWEEINRGTPGANFGWPLSEGSDGLVAGMSGPLFTYGHVAASPPGSGPGGFFVGTVVIGGTFYPSADGPQRFPAAYRNNYYFADFVNQFIGRIDIARNDAAYAFASLSGAPVDLLAGIDGALYALTRTGVTRISYP